ncbi:hypothetical protein GCM10010510_32050 [Streptomyces anandii JCM 4720]|nr:hypothetical protein GCM10010510_32050 [Streptomyces anandii JCM 4720]
MVDAPVGRPTPQNPLNENSGVCVTAPEADVEEPGPGDGDVVDAIGPKKMTTQHVGDPKGGLPGRPRQLKGDVTGVVTAPPGAGRRHHDPLRYGDAQLPRVDSPTHRAPHGTGELDGGHGTSVGEEGGG